MQELSYSFLVSHCQWVVVYAGLTKRGGTGLTLGVFRFWIVVYVGTHHVGRYRMYTIVHVDCGLWCMQMLTKQGGARLALWCMLIVVYGVCRHSPSREVQVWHYFYLLIVGCGVCRCSACRRSYNRV